VYRAEILVAVVVALLNVVDTVGAGLAAEVADAVVSGKDAVSGAALPVPVSW
jgi:hypothetical protein